ncbi:diguanylate cyclase [Microbulbifer sp. 2205BS26-8]|uniref:GGDEF domain-containing protein n=1 Tax=Microbulbifer sp. 2205BS26-8 TaxID=3064386 RepID=UPI0027400A74|nr:GGDEF domain-containing protein [Microbulbifer sp. 2205BS26-8]MDP5209511.1 GGDEF domain-containing protein [Microbulbifer sp. 2205BS26-8]
MPSYLQWLRFFWLPGLILILPFAHYLPWLDLGPLYNKQLPFFLLGAALVLSVLYRSSRVALASGLFLLLYAATSLGLLPEGVQGLPLYLALMALNLMLIACARDRGALSLIALAWLLVLIAQGMALFLLQECCRPLSYQFVLENLPVWVSEDRDASVILPLLVCVAAAAGASLLFILFPGPAVAGLFSCTLLLSYGIWTGLPLVPIASAAGLLLILSLLGAGYEFAFRDALTGLLSRRAFYYHMLAPGRHYSLAMIDIDHFKKLNDRFGHQTGDQVLRMVAGLINRHTTGRVFRFGGEEFAVVIPGRDRMGAEKALGHLCGKIAAYPLRLRAAGRLRDRMIPGRSGQRIKVTVSIGLTHREKSLKKPDAVLKAADLALYKAKRSGRNRLCVHVEARDQSTKCKSGT